MAKQEDSKQRKRKRSIPLTVYNFVTELEILLDIRLSHNSKKDASPPPAHGLGSHSAHRRAASRMEENSHHSFDLLAHKNYSNNKNHLSTTTSSTMNVAYTYDSSTVTTTTQENDDDNRRRHTVTTTTASMSDDDDEYDNHDANKTSLMNLVPTMQLIAGGLNTVDVDTLRQAIDPIWKSIERLDAIAMLNLERTTSDKGAKVADGVFCKPIHDEVTPIRRRKGSTVRYVHISEVPGMYSVGIFIFPPHARIPLHDHPNMVVLSRVLYGDLERLSLDLCRATAGCTEDEAALHSTRTTTASSSSWFPRWNTVSAAPTRTSTGQQLPSGSKRAYWNGHDYLQAPNVTALYPYEGQLHEFRAGPHGAAVLDVLLPPYDEDDERDCTFYDIVWDSDRRMPMEQQQQQQQRVVELGREQPKRQQPCWIVPTGQPEDFHCLSGRYCDLGGDYFSDDDPA